MIAKSDGTSRTQRRRFRRGRILPAVALLALALAACSPDTHFEGYHIDQDRFERIQPGITTQQQVSDLLGSPSSIATFRENSDTWYYISKEIESLTELDSEVVGQQVVAVDFDQLGRVEKIRRYGLKDARDISISSRKTQTQGRELTFLEQLFGNSVLGAGAE